jgi:hypothetical protein
MVLGIAEEHPESPVFEFNQMTGIPRIDPSSLDGRRDAEVGRPLPCDAIIIGEPGDCPIADTDCNNEAAGVRFFFFTQPDEAACVVVESKRNGDGITLGGPAVPTAYEVVLLAAAIEPVDVIVVWVDVSHVVAGTVSGFKRALLKLPGLAPVRGDVLPDHCSSSFVTLETSPLWIKAIEEANRAAIRFGQQHSAVGRGSKEPGWLRDVFEWNLECDFIGSRNGNERQYESQPRQRAESS